MRAKVNLATREIRRNVPRYSLLSGAVALLVLLLLFLTSLSSALLISIVGAVRNQTADVLVYSSVSRRNIESSRLNPASVAAVANTPGVEAASAWNASTLTVTNSGGRNVSVIGFDPSGPGRPTETSDTRLGPDEALIDSGNVDDFPVGISVTFEGTDKQVRIVGTADKSGFLVQPTLWVELDTYAKLQKAIYPQATSYPINLVAASVSSSDDPAGVLDAIEERVDGSEALTRQQAVDSISGVNEIAVSFAIIIFATAVIVVLVVGFFFLIFTVQKLGAYAALRAIGAQLGDLAKPTLVQIAAVVITGSAIAVGVLAATFASASFGLPVALDWRVVGASVTGILAAALLTGFISIRRIAKEDPAAVAAGRNR